MIKFTNKTFFSAVLFVFMYGVPVVNAEENDGSTFSMIESAAKSMNDSIPQYHAELKKKLNKKHHKLLEKFLQSAQNYFSDARDYEIVSEGRGTMDRSDRFYDIAEKIKNDTVWIQWVSGFIRDKQWCDIWDDIAPGLYHPKKYNLRQGITDEDKAMVEKENRSLKKSVSDLMAELKKTITKHKDKLPATIGYVDHAAPLQSLWNQYVKDFGNLVYAMAEDCHLSSEGRYCSSTPNDIKKNREVLVQQWTSFLLTQRIKDLKDFKEEIELHVKF